MYEITDVQVTPIKPKEDAIIEKFEQVTKSTEPENWSYKFAFEE